MPAIFFLFYFFFVFDTLAFSFPHEEKNPGENKSKPNRSPACNGRSLKGYQCVHYWWLSNNIGALSPGTRLVFSKLVNKQGYGGFTPTLARTENISWK